MSIEGLDPWPDAPPHDASNALQISYDRPALYRPDKSEAKGIKTYDAGPYARIVIQGDAKYVELIHRFLNVELQWMWDDISRDRAVERAKG
jgi:hypothetical protein